METIIEQLESALKALRSVEDSIAKSNLEKDLQIIKLTRGNETLQEVIKMKDDLIIPELKETIKFFKPGSKEEKKNG